MTEDRYRLHSDILQNERTIWIRRPTDGVDAECLVVFLDAELYRDRIGAPQIIDGLQQRRVIPPCLSVFVSYESVASRWIECPCHAPFAGFIDQELLPWVEALHPEVARMPHRVLAGLSYTGLAAAFVALQSPLRFTHVVAQSGSFWSDDCWLVEQYRSLRRRLPVEFYLEVGTRETQVNVTHKEDVVQVISQIEGVRRFRDALIASGHRPIYFEFDGAHEFTAWARTLRNALRWALAAEEENELNHAPHRYGGHRPSSGDSTA
jgi:enterochelin esterase-like enzyme